MVKKVFLVLANIVCLFATMACGGNTDTGFSPVPSSSSAGDAPSQSAKPSGNKGDVHVLLADGSSDQIGDQKVSINKITDDAQSTNQFETPGDGKKFWTADVVIQNTGTKDTFGGSWKLRTKDDTEYDTTIAVGLGDSLSFGTLSGVGKTQGTIVFAIPTDAQPKWLVFKPTSLFSNHGLYFDGQ